jgi:hypothetical protein
MHPYKDVNWIINIGLSCVLSMFLLILNNSKPKSLSNIKHREKTRIADYNKIKQFVKK